MKKTRLHLPEPEAVCDVRRIRERVLRKARRLGLANYYLGLNNRPELVLSVNERKAPMLAESSIPYRVTVPEPEGVREVRQWRQKIQQEMDRLGSDEYLRRLNARAAELLGVAKKSKRSKSHKTG